MTVANQAEETDRCADLCREAQLLRELFGHGVENLDGVVRHALFLTPWFSANQKYSEVLRFLQIVWKRRPRILCEIGAGKGGNLALLAQVAAPDARILSIDTCFTPEQLAAFPLLGAARQQITCLRGDSTAPSTLESVRQWLSVPGIRGSQEGQLDLLFVDGDHSYNGVSRDFRAYSPLVRVGGLIAFHDIVPDFLTRYGVDTILRTGDVPTFWSVMKERYPNHDEIVEHRSQDGYGIGILHWQGDHATNARGPGQAAGDDGATRLPLESSSGPSRMSSGGDRRRARLIAFYLPQFHQIPENDAWWGKGFTEWTNVTKARPLFRGHYQPRLPGELGFYDLRTPEVRQGQAELAQAHGIEAFCYWHYWFEGKRLLERPFHEVLASGEPRMPFCLAWANEPWSRGWLGEKHSVLQPQTYSKQDDHEHARWLVRAFANERYVRVMGRPVFVIYRPLDLPEPQRTTDIFRDEARRQGLPEPYLIANYTSHLATEDIRRFGYDALMVFEPSLSALPMLYDAEGQLDAQPRRARLRHNLRLGVKSAKLKVYDYAEARSLMCKLVPPLPHYSTVLVGWDNTPRRGRDGIMLLNATPETFQAALEPVVQSVTEKPFDDRLVFLNAWNEWAEGNYLEPDQKFGRAFLEAVRRINVRVD